MQNRFRDDIIQVRLIGSKEELEKIGQRFPVTITTIKKARNPKYSEEQWIAYGYIQ